MDLTGFSKGIIRPLLFFGIFFLSSCVSQKKLEYLQFKNKEMAYPANFEDHILKPFDELFVQISGVGDEATGAYSGSSAAEVSSTSSTGASLMSQVIDKEGYIEIPLLGKVLAKDKTLAQFKTFIRDSLVNIVNQPIVTVKLVNQYFTVLGDVRNPGRFSYNQEKLSILDAISMAGDALTYGNRGKVLIVREENKTNKLIEVDLLKADILQSSDYYIKSGDLIYIKPLRRKVWGAEELSSPSFALSILTTLLVVFTFTTRNQN